VKAPAWTFPAVTGRDLAGREYRLPADLPAALTVAILAFRQWQQSQVDAWIAALVAAGVPGTPRGAHGLASVVVGMASSIRDPDILARTITVYGHVDRFCAPLGIVDTGDVSVRVVAPTGAVHWGTTGPVTAPAIDAIVASLDQHR
jgi:hypothetical protein